MAEQFVTAIKTTEIPEGGLTAVDVRGSPIAVASVAGAYYAFDDTCTRAVLTRRGRSRWHQGHVYVPRRGIRCADGRRARASSAASREGVPHQDQQRFASNRDVMPRS